MTETRTLVMMVGIELLDGDDPTMIATGVATAVRDAIGPRQGLASMIKVTHLPVGPLLHEFGKGTRVNDIGTPNG